MITKITGEMCVKVLKEHKEFSLIYAADQAITAKDIARALDTDSRAVATALRKPVKDGRVKTVADRKHWSKFGVWCYKFVRSTPAKKKGGAA